MVVDDVRARLRVPAPSDEGDAQKRTASAHHYIPPPLLGGLILPA